jgi:cytochrome P450
MIENPLGVLLDHTKTYGDTYYYHFGGVKKVLVSSNPSLLAHILRRNHQNYRKSDIQTRLMAEFLGKGLLTAHGREWQVKRRMIQQGFRPGALASLVPTMQGSLESSLDRFDLGAERGPIDVCSWMMSMTFSMVATSLFGAEITEDEIGRISAAITVIQKHMVRRIVQPYLLPWFVISGELRRQRGRRNEGDAILLRQIRRRQASSEPHFDLLQTLLEAADEATGERMLDDQILHESMQLMVAGHETSSNALAWTIYLLCRNPTYAERAREELEAVVTTGTLQYANLPRLKVCTRILQEALRLYPPFWMVDRVAIQDDRIGEIKIPRGTMIIALLYAAHHSDRHWDDPEAFDPDRFAVDQKGMAELCYLPFGSGPRACIGANYAMLQMLMILHAVLTRYDISLAHSEPISIAPMFILRPRGGIFAYVRCRGGKSQRQDGGTE